MFFFPFMISKTVFCASRAYKPFRFESEKTYLRTKESVHQESRAGVWGRLGHIFGFFWYENKSLTLYRESLPRGASTGVVAQWRSSLSKRISPEFSQKVVQGIWERVNLRGPDCTHRAVSGETRLGRQPQAFSHRFLCPLPQVDHLDKNGQCALVHAALRGHLEVVKFLIQCDWTMAGQQQGVFKKSHAIQQALIAAASMGYTEVRKQPTRLGLFFVFFKLCLEGNQGKNSCIITKLPG